MRKLKVKSAQVEEVLRAVLKGNGVDNTIFHIHDNLITYYTSNDKKRADGKLYAPDILEKDGFLDWSNDAIVSTTQEEKNADEYFTKLIEQNKKIYLSVFCGGLEISSPDKGYEHYKDYKGLPVIHPQILANVSKIGLALLPVYNLFTDEICDYVVELPLEKGDD